MHFTIVYGHFSATRVITCCCTGIIIGATGFGSFGIPIQLTYVIIIDISVVHARG